MLKDTDYINIGRRNLTTVALDLKCVHGIELHQDLSDEHCLAVGKEVVEQKAANTLKATEDSKREQLEFNEMDGVDRNYIIAKQAYNAKHNVLEGY